MKIHILETEERAGYEAARVCEEIIQKAVNEQGEARIVLSTGASQFEFFKHFVKMDIQWDKVVMFHLDEYIDLPESHPASFRRYLRERFLNYVNLKEAWLVHNEGDLEQIIQTLGKEISKAPIDLALIGIGENAHIAFNDPPANFETEEPYIIIELNETCKAQQVREGWFSALDKVPQKAITMTVKQILKSKHIVSIVPNQEKAEAVWNTLSREVDNQVPATILKTNAEWQLFLEKNSASKFFKSV